MSSALVTVRLAATLAHTVPGVRLRLRVGDGASLDVVDVPSGDAPAVSASVFRQRVVEWWRAEEAGCDVLSARLPSIELGVPEGGRVHPSGILRVLCDRTELSAFATTLSPQQCRRLFAVRAAEWIVHLHRDEATGVTVVHHQATPRRRAVVAELMEDLLGTCVAEELVSA